MQSIYREDIVEEVREPEVSQEESFRFCYHCGEELTEEVSGCPKCGKTL